MSTCSAEDFAGCTCVFQSVMVLECDEPIPEEIAGELRSQPGIVKVTILNL